MSVYSYFLPKSLREKISNTSDGNGAVKILNPVFTSKVHPADEMVVTNYGKCVSVSKSYNNEISYNTALFFNDKFYNSELISVTLGEKYAISPQGDVVVTANRQSFKDRIFISCAKVVNLGGSKLEGNVILEYDYYPHFYDLFISNDMRVCIVSNNISGMLTLDTLSYELNDSAVKIHHDRRVKVPYIQRRSAIKVYFTLCDKKLFFVNIFARFVLAYSLDENSFGPAFELGNGKSDESYHPDLTCFYAYEKYIGNMLMICYPWGEVKVLRENRLSISLLHERDLDLREYIYPDICMKCLHVDYSNGIRFFVVPNKNSAELFVFDYFQRRVVCRFTSPDDSFIQGVKTNWSGEEIFVLTSRLFGIPDRTLTMLFYNKNSNISSLKQLSKRAVLQSYSLEDVRTMDLPRMLKREINLMDSIL